MASTSDLEAVVTVNGSKRSWASFKVGNPVMMQVSSGTDGETEERTPISCPCCLDTFFTKSTNLPRNKSLVCRAHLNTLACRTKRGAVDATGATESMAGEGHMAMVPATVPAPERGVVIVDQVSKSRQRGMRHAECQQRHEALRVELESKHSELRAELGSKIDSLTGDVSELKRLGSFVEDVFVSVLPSLQDVRPFIDHQPRLKHHLELGIQAIQLTTPVHTSAGIELDSMEVRLKEKDVLIARLEEEARLRKRNHGLTMAENAKLVVETESLKTELRQRTAQLEHKQQELSTLHENIRCLKETSLHANMKAAQRHSKLYLETCYKLGNAMDVVLKHTSTDFSKQRFHEDLYAYSRGLRERAMNPPNMRPFVEFPTHRDDDSGEDEDLEGIDDSTAAGPSDTGRGTPVPTSVRKRRVEDSHGDGNGAPRSRPSSRASNASPSKRSKPSGSGKEPLNIVELCKGSNALMKDAERALASRK